MEIDIESSSFSQEQYRANASYSASFMPESSNPEEYHFGVRMLEEIISLFILFIDEHDEYSHLRSIDISLIKPNDWVCSINHGAAIVIEIIGDIVLLSKNGEQIEEKKTDIRPMDEYISNLKFEDINKIYSFIRSKMEKISFTEIDFFSTFSEYFRIDAKMLYNALSVNIQASILTELDRKTNCLSKRNIYSLW